MPRDQPDESEFGSPPSLITGLFTAIVGAGAGVLSLAIFFAVWEPDTYVSPRWLAFVLFGGIVGFYLRLERPFIRKSYKNLTADSNGRI